MQINVQDSIVINVDMPGMPMIYVGNSDYNAMKAHKTTDVIDHPDGSVTTEKIADGAITPDKLNDSLKQTFNEHTDNINSNAEDIENIRADIESIAARTTVNKKT